MRVKFIQDEDFLQYKVGCLFIGTPSCTWKCLKEAGLPCSICQNYSWSKEKIHEVSNEEIYNRFVNNPLTEGVVFGGLEPMDNFEEVYDFIEFMREERNDNSVIVIYTGWTEEEVAAKVERLTRSFTNIVIKFGRYKPNYEKHYDEVLGIDLASPNQYGKIIC